MHNKSKFIIALISLLPSVALASPGDEFPAGDFALSIRGRPDTPHPPLRNYNRDLTQQGIGAEFSVPVSRHHIIPLNVLRSFYDRVAENNQFHYMSGFFNSYANNVRFYASSNGINCNAIGPDLIDAANLALAHRYGLVHSGGSRTPQGFDTFEQFYAWLPGNLFVGPRDRLDDPGEKFESNAHVVVGAAYFDILARVNQNMRRHINGDNSQSL